MVMFATVARWRFVEWRPRFLRVRSRRCHHRHRSSRDVGTRQSRHRSLSHHHVFLYYGWTFCDDGVFGCGWFFSIFCGVKITFTFGYKTSLSFSLSFSLLCYRYWIARLILVFLLVFHTFGKVSSSLGSVFTVFSTRRRRRRPLL